MKIKYYYQIIFVVVAILMLSSCQGSPSITQTELVPKLSQQNPSIRGDIQEIFTTKGSVSGLYVEGIKEKDTSYDRALVGIDEKTKIFRKQGNEYLNAAGSDLQVGQIVEILFSDPIQTSNPVQANALEIIITK
jgi:hypothetical protein